MHSKHHIGCALLLFLSLSTTSVMAQSPPNLTGTWQAKEAGRAIVLALNPDGTGKLDDTPIKYAIKGSALMIEEGGTVHRYTFVFKGKSLTLSGGDLSQPMTFEHQEAEAATGLGARRKPAAPASPAPTAAPTGQVASTGLVGQWQGPNGIVQINDSGLIVIANETYRYTATDNLIIISGAEGPVYIPYQINGETLTALVNGQQQTLRRLGTMGVPGRAENTAGVAMELVGKWCYFSSVSATGGGRMSDECFTLYPNGTYEYANATSSSNPFGGTASQAADSGTWSATATAMTARSRSQGTTTYPLEKRNHPKTGDPMLCLDGRCFVTYAQRSPWR